MTKYTYAILGSGRQGTAAAYDLAKFGEAQKIILADVSEEAAAQSAGRINKLIGRQVAFPQQLDVSDSTGLAQTLEGIDVTLSAVPYYFNLDISKAAIQAKANMCDLGGHIGIARKQHALHAEAQQAGVSIIFTSDTAPTERIWEVANSTDDLAAVITEVSFPNRLQDVADVSLHMTPQGLVGELAKLKKDVAVFLYHFKPPYVDELRTELAGSDLPHAVEELVQDRTYRF